MISGIRGKIARFGASSVHLDTGGVEYEVHVPLNVFEKLQTGKEKEVHLFVYHHFMQDEQRLFGFQEPGQRTLFAALKTIKGLGTSLALSLLSHLDGVTLLELCINKDIKTLCKIPRVGKSTAETLSFEINRKKDKWEKIILAEGTKKPAARDTQEELAFQALVQLGYKDKECAEVLLKLKTGKDRDASELIREALRLL